MSRFHGVRVVLLLSTIVLSHAATGDELEREIVRHDADVAKLQQTFDDGVAAANEKAIKAYARIAQRQARAGDGAGAALAWKEVLRLQRTHVEARAFFTQLNTLDAVLVELDQPQTDLLGNPVGPAAAGGGHPALYFNADSALVPSPDTVLTSGFTTRTTELIVGRTSGDGLFFEEGGPGNGQAIGLTGNDLIYVVRADAKMVTIKAPFDRKAAWTFIAAQFSAGEMRLWINRTLVAKGNAGFSAIPPHGDGGLGKGSGPNPSDWLTNCQFALAGFRMTSTARYTDQIGPDGSMTIDKNTLLGVTAETIIAEMAPATTPRDISPTALKKLGGMPAGSPVWTVSGSVQATR
jgi:hypothetical protein